MHKSLNADGTDYQGHLGLEDPRFLECWEHLRKVLADALHRLSRREILEAWSPDVPQPNVDTLWRWLNRAVHQGLVLRAGEGTKSDPYRYWLPGQKFPKNPVEALIAEKSRKVQRELSRSVFDVDFDATHPRPRRRRSG